MPRKAEEYTWTFTAVGENIRHNYMFGNPNLGRLGQMHLANTGVICFDDLPHYDKRSLGIIHKLLDMDSVVNLGNMTNDPGSNIPFDSCFVATFNPCKCGFYQTKPNQTKEV